MLTFLKPTTLNRAFYIVGIVFAVVFLFVGGYYAEEVDNAKWSSFYESISSYDDFGYSYNYDSDYEAEGLTVAAGLWSLFFFLAFMAIDILGLLKIKTTTVKVFSIIGMSLSGIFLLWDFAVIASPGSLSFDEVYPGWVLYCLIMLAFSIVGLVQSVRYHKRQTGVVNTQTVSSSEDTTDLLDS